MQITPAQTTLAALGDGQVMKDLATSIHDAIAAVGERGKPATVTLVITTAPMKSEARVVEAPLFFSGEVSAKLPKPEPQQHLFYVDDDGNPSRQPARQTGLPLSIAAREQS